ncbi:sensor domain-containing diguanylate cyclase [Pseudomonas sp. sp1636]|uniref:sensor domain-containing diguanylate cyclase n=1 Tax=Pseudomonas sp. sp1636 TaxID=3036707 RepID=UPI0025A67DCD|nr:diguanylate cyclase [Pseudomonas sp. sp1636]MDM8350108.1 sensor domain-containing diguanylate cyclase [Pseudomonas sp. sp1636]
MLAALRVLLLLLLPSLSQASVLSLPATGQAVLPGPFMQVWQDPQQRATLDDVRSLPDSAWQPVGRRDASFGYTGSAYWLRLQLHNPAARPMDWLLLIGNPLLDYLDAYGLEGERVYRSGDQRPFAARWLEHRQLLLPLSLAAGESRELILRMQTEGSANLSASLMTREAFNRHEQRMLLLQGLFFGALAAMCIYNLSIFIITRDRNYLWYSLFVASFGGYQFIQLGFALQWLWPHSLAWHQLSFPLSSTVAILFGILFTHGVLDLRHASQRYTQVVRILLSCTALAIGLSLFAPYRVALLASFALVIACAVLACLFTLLRWREGYKPARLFAIGWFVLIAASLFSILSGTGLIAHSRLALHAQQIGGLIELAVFSIALAARIRQAQHAQGLAQMQLLAQEQQLSLEQTKNLNLQRQLNEGLETRVQQRTAALEQALAALSGAHQQLSELSRRDSLTGLFNRQTLNEELRRSLAQAVRSQRPMAILMMDLDHFKQVNDRYGHLAGDACLHHAAQRLQQRLRAGDLLARFGGEEFVAVLGDTDLAGAHGLAEQLRDDLARHPCSYQDQSIELTISIGVCAEIPDSADSKQLLNRADQALYRAKAGGRNRVENYEASSLNEA